MWGRRRDRAPNHPPWSGVSLQETLRMPGGVFWRFSSLREMLEWKKRHDRISLKHGSVRGAPPHLRLLPDSAGTRDGNRPKGRAPTRCVWPRPLAMRRVVSLSPPGGSVPIF